MTTMTKNDHQLSVREMQAEDVDRIVNYWLNAEPGFLVGMGVDLAKMPSRADMTAMLSAQLTKPYPEKQSYCIIWEIDGQPAPAHMDARCAEQGQRRGTGKNEPALFFQKPAVEKRVL